MVEFTDKVKEFFEAVKLLANSKPQDFRAVDSDGGMRSALIALILLFLSFLILVYAFIRLL